MLMPFTILLPPIENVIVHYSTAYPEMEILMTGDLQMGRVLFETTVPVK